MCFVRLVALSKVCVSELGRVFFFVRTRQSLTHLWKERKKEKKNQFLFNFEEEISDVFHDWGFYVILTVKYQENSTGAEWLYLTFNRDFASYYRQKIIFIWFIDKYE